MIDLNHIRSQFPILERQIYGKPLAYLDSAASAQKPNSVLNAMKTCYREHYANVHRGLHRLSEESTDAYESVRGKVASFINASHPDEVILTNGGTIAFNMIAYAWGGKYLDAGDEILISVAEHHANIVPWQMIAAQKGAKLRAVPIEDDGSISLDKIKQHITERTKIVAMPHVSNVLGTVFPLKEIAAMAHDVGAIFVVDGCQGVVHLPVDVAAFGCDFYIFSGHKLYGPGGVGVVWGRASILEGMPPFLGGGDMIDRVSIEHSTYAKPPHRFEAGTPPIVETIGMGAAIDFVQDIGINNMREHEKDMLDYMQEQLASIDGLKLIGTAADKSGVVSFVLDGVHPHDISTIVDREGVAIRAGHHCAQPLMDFLGVNATARASIGVYTCRDDIDALVRGLNKVKKIFAQ